MSTVGSIKKVKTNASYKFFGPDSTVSEIADTMDIEDIGAVPVLDENHYLMGVVSERDIVRKLVKDGRDSDLVTAKDIMTKEVITVRKETTILEALKLIKTNNIRHLPVVDEANKLLNFISLRDIMGAPQSNRKLSLILIGFVVVLIPIILIFK